MDFGDGSGDGVGLGDIDGLTLGNGGDGGFGAYDCLVDTGVFVLGGD